MLKTWIAAAAASLGLAWAAPLDTFLLSDVSYDESIPTPDEIFGHGLGDKPIRHDQLVEYLTLLSASSERIDHEVIGRTHEGRPILLLTVTSPGNHGKIDELREQHLASLEGKEVPADAPAVVWMNYGVHGAESAGMDAVVPTAYHFAAAKGDEVEAQLDDAIILMVAILNPDGHSRRADHVETFMGKVPVTDPAHAQHQLWIEARTNHYWFDLNRQWLLQTQPESRAWVEHWQRWKPMVSADFHEMGSNSTYYFHPGEPKRKNPLIPDEARDLALGIAQNHRGFLDSEGRLYFTEQGFDNFYIGKGSTYPQVNGGIGILFEVGAARGGAVESPSGLRSYADNIRTHFRTSLTTIEGSLERKEAIATYQRGYFAQAEEEAREHPVKAYVFSGGNDFSRTRRFIDVLNRHDIDVHHLAEDVSAGDMDFVAGEAFIVPLAQMQHRMLRGVFDRVTEFEENIFYDVSGWTLPLAYDLTHAPLKMRPARGEDAGRFTESLIGAEVAGQDMSREPELPQEASYGYFFSWADTASAKALYQVLDEDLLARVAVEPSVIRTSGGDVETEPGTVFVPLAGQTEPIAKVHRVMRRITRDTGVKVYAATSGAGETATASVGGSSFRPVTKPSVLLVFDDGLSRTDTGEVWHHLDFETEVPVTLRRKDELGGLDWSRYTHLVMAGGGRVAPSDSAAERIVQWVREEGGTLIGLRQSAHWIQENVRKLEKEEPKKEDDEEELLRYDYAEKDVRDAEHVIGGAIVATDIDTTHPLGFGLQDRELPVIRNTTAVLAVPEGNPYAVVAAYPEENMVLSGYVSERREGEIAGTPAVIAERVGRGTVIMIADNPVFRATFPGSGRVLTNAIFLSELIDRPRGDYEEE